MGRNVSAIVTLSRRGKAEKDTVVYLGDDPEREILGDGKQTAIPYLDLSN